MQKSFIDLGVLPQLAAGLEKGAIVLPTAIQTAVIPAAMEGKSVVGQSPTGTGKTLAYLLPLLQKVDAARREPQALILAPTHELAIQIQRQAERLIRDADMALTVLPVIGDVNIQRQIERLKEKPQIIVGSCGRILELIRKRKITAHTVKTIVIDEADRLLDDNNIEGVRAIIKTTLKERQLLLFSATIPPATLERARSLDPGAPWIVSKVPTEGMPVIQHWYFITEQRDKMELLRKLAGTLAGERALVFVNKGGDIEITTAKLNYLGLKAAGLYGAAAKESRQKAVEDFRSGKLQFLVASDLAARGLDIPDIEYIFNLDIPEAPEVYLHRAGRTARAGKTGTVLSLATRRELAFLETCRLKLKIGMARKEMIRGRIVDDQPGPGKTPGRARRRTPS